MIPSELNTLFWDTDGESFQPEAWPEYSIFRVLEYGDDAAVAWMRQTFSEAQIRQVLTSERRLTPRSANFWALVYGIPSSEVPALTQRQ